MLTMTYPNNEDLEKKVCIICAPTLAKVLHEEWDLKVTILDIDDRFKDTLPGYKHWDLQTPEYFENDFELIFIDPPFFYISLDQMAKAMSVLANGRPTKLLISFMIREG